MKQALSNVGHSVILEEFVPKEQKAEVPYEEILRNVQRSDYVFLFLTDNVILTPYTRNWVSHEVGVASALQKRLFVFERKGYPLPYPIPYVTDFMLFDENEVVDILNIQLLAKKAGEIPRPLVGGGAGAVAGIPFGPLGVFIFGLIGAVVGKMTEQPLLRLRCSHCRTPFNYWSPQVQRFHCPCCRSEMNASMKDGVT